MFCATQISRTTALLPRFGRVGPLFSTLTAACGRNRTFIRASTIFPQGQKLNSFLASSCPMRPTTVILVSKAYSTESSPNPKYQVPHSTPTSGPSQSRNKSGETESTISPKDSAYYPYSIDIQALWKYSEPGIDIPSQLAQMEADVFQSEGQQVLMIELLFHYHFELIVHTYLIEAAGMCHLSPISSDDHHQVQEKQQKHGLHGYERHMEPTDITVWSTSSLCQILSDNGVLSLSSLASLLQAPGKVEVRLAVSLLELDQSLVEYQIGIFKTGALAGEESSPPDKNVVRADIEHHLGGERGRAVAVGSLRQIFVMSLHQVSEDHWAAMPISIPEAVRTTLEKICVLVPTQ
ncbi:hypothetical protein BG011_009796 [Mortierella polycephala]|uniref:Uncharacterized protein n=1 Tax=Mortierella polycephala TaxID=41804 RepID=A0A9P6U7N8_9FUNG|nr:hypothetical protein BG011_009796 [Mortierella polycephala]